VADNAGVLDDYRRVSEEWAERLFAMDEVGDHPEAETAATVSVTGLVTYAQCPKRFYWTDVDPLPRRRNDAAVRGSEIHRRIELHQRGQVPFEDLEPDLYDVIDGDFGPGAYSVYEGSRFARMKAAFVEAPFTFLLGNGYKVRGRIDAIYIDGEDWEVVDFKTGKPKEDPARIVQLEAYAVAVDDVDFTDAKPGSLDVTFAYLGGSLEEESSSADRAWVDGAREHLESLAAGIETRQFEPSPGQWCHNCDFLQFCEVGKREVAS
jgi:predicted RecB family nuclease